MVNWNPHKPRPVRKKKCLADPFARSRNARHSASVNTWPKLMNTGPKVLCICERKIRVKLQKRANHCPANQGRGNSEKMEPLRPRGLWDCAYALAEENPRKELELIRGIRSVEHLHEEFYEVYMTLRTMETWCPYWESCGVSFPTITPEGENSASKTPASLTVRYRAYEGNGTRQSPRPFLK